MLFHPWPVSANLTDGLTGHEEVDAILKLVIVTARTGQVGDGRIFVVPVAENYHVRTGFMDLE